MKNIILFSWLLTFSLYANGQKKFGEMPSMEMLEQMVHPQDTSADAAYIFKDVKVQYDFSNPTKAELELLYHYRIKVYSEAGEDYADFEIPMYRDGSDRESVFKIKGITTNLVNGTPVRTELNKKNIYEEETSENWKTVKFAMPDVRSGSIIDVTYKFVTPYIYSIDKWYFQDFIPVESSHYQIHVPDMIALTPIATGTIPINNDNGNANRYGNKIYNLTAENVPAFEPDEYILDDSDYRSGIKYELLHIDWSGGRKTYSSDWPKIAKTLKDHSSFGRTLKKKIDVFKPDVEKAKSMPLDDRKLYLFELVRDHFTWNERYGKYAEDGLKVAALNKSGNIGEINLTLINLLRAAEVEAYPLVTKNRYQGILNGYYPSITELDYVLAYLPNPDGSYILLDASSKFNQYGQLPTRAINLNGLLIQDQLSQFVEIQNPNIYKVESLSDYSVTEEDLMLTGSRQVKLSNKASEYYREDHKEDSSSDEDEEEEDEDEDDEESEEEEINNIYEILEVRNLDDIEKPVTVKYQETLIDCVKKIGDKIFIDACFDFGMDENPFTQAKRDYPIFYPYKQKIRRTTKLNIPEGYKVESHPEDAVIGLPNEDGRFMYQTNVVNNSLVITYTFDINNLIHLPENYPGFKKFYEMAFDLTKEKIVLKKTE